MESLPEVAPRGCQRATEAVLQACEGDPYAIC